MHKIHDFPRVKNKANTNRDKSKALVREIRIY